MPGTMENKSEWLNQRWWTTYICMALSVVSGIEFSCTSVSLIYYLKEDVKVSHVQEWYSILMSSVYVVSGFSGIILGRLMDKRRNLRCLLLILVFIAILGNLIYTMHLSVWLLLLGRCLCALVDAAQPVISGELSRCYLLEELTPVMINLQIAYAVGFVLGPATTLLSSVMNFNIGEWYINKNNGIGVIMAILFFFLYLAILLKCHDLSKDYSDSTGTEDEPLIKDSIQEEPTKKYKLLNICDVMTNPDLMALIMPSALLAFTGCSNELLATMIGQNTFKLGLITLSLLMSLCVAIFIVIMLTCWKRVFRGPISIKALFLCIILSFIGIALLFVSKLFVINNLGVQALFIIVIVLMYSLSGLSVDAVVRPMVFSLVPPNSASYIEGVRAGINKLFGFIGFFTAAYVFEHMLEILPAVGILLLIVTIPLFCRCKHIRNPSLDKYESDDLTDP